MLAECMLVAFPRWLMSRCMIPSQILCLMSWVWVWVCCNFCKILYYEHHWQILIWFPKNTSNHILSISSPYNLFFCNVFVYSELFIRVICFSVIYSLVDFLFLISIDADDLQVFQPCYECSWRKLCWSWYVVFWHLRQDFSLVLLSMTKVFVTGDAVVNVYINHEKKFAFVEMRTVEEASNAMALDGILFEVWWTSLINPSNCPTLSYLHFSLHT